VDIIVEINTIVLPRMAASCSMRLDPAFLDPEGVRKKYFRRYGHCGGGSLITREGIASRIDPRIRTIMRLLSMSSSRDSRITRTPLSHFF
jgi:hypothetical protein